MPDGIGKGLSAGIEKALIATLVMALGVIAAVATRMAMRRSLQQRLPGHVYKPLENLVFFTILFSAGVAALGALGVNVSGLLVAGGFAGIVVGFAAQQTVSNLISGLFLLAEQPLRVGDPVTVSNVSGVVADISILSTKIRTWDGYIVRIPNSTVFNEAITNYVRTRARRVEIRVGISYGSSIRDALEAVLELMREHPFCLVNPAPEAFVEDYGDSAIVINARCWAPPQVWFKTRTELLTALKERLEKHGVEIPFPQLDLHIRDSVPFKVELGGGSERGPEPSSRGRG